MQPKHFHLIGVCGTAMGSLAGMLKAQGHHVTGSDKAFYPPMGDELIRLGIETYEGFAAEHLRQPDGLAPDVVVVGNATSRGNAEIEYALNAKLRCASMPEVIREHFIRGKHSTVVAGTHGKTTTTSLMAWTMQVAGVDPSFLIGGVAENFGASFKVASSSSGSQHFVIEGDEYDTAYFDKGPKFLHYLPDLVILNNVEYDHADIYDDLEAVKKSFRLLINLIPSNGRLLAGWDSPVVRELIEQPIAPQGVWCPVESFGLEAGAKWTARNVAYLPDETRFTVFVGGREYATFRTPLAGEFNVRNCLGVIAAADVLGLERQAVAEALATFKSVKRRMQVRGEVNGVTVIDDFAHHPTAVRETLRAIAQKYPNHRLVAVFEPRTWASRKQVFQADYARAFDPAGYVVVAALYEAYRVQASEQMSIERLIEDLQVQGKPAFAIDGAEAIVEHLKPELRAGDVVAVMSNGGFGGIHQKLLDALASK
jgi:UDP-N-acetylmuramate: L-alanyl-gamma-D-glutamyl-meso-diaminopimelate ligase